MTRTVFDVLPERSRNIQAAVDERLVGAYKAFLAGHPSAEDCEIILVDLAQISGYYDTTLVDAPADQVKYVEGGRNVFSRILRCANAPFTEVQALHQAVIRVQQETTF